MKKTLVLGASENPNRYSYLAIQSLLKKGYEVEGVGAKQTNINGVTIHNSPVAFKDIDTITLYLSAKNQVAYYDYILQINPRRVIFNPGTYNIELETLLKSNQIEALHACTLVLLSTQQY